MNIEQFKDKKILITGASGFVGKNLVKQLPKETITRLIEVCNSELKSRL